MKYITVPSRTLPIRIPFSQLSVAWLDPGSAAQDTARAYSGSRAAWSVADGEFWVAEGVSSW